MTVVAPHFISEDSFSLQVRLSYTVLQNGLACIGSISAQVPRIPSEVRSRQPSWRLLLILTPPGPPFSRQVLGQQSAAFSIPRTLQNGRVAAGARFPVH